MATTNPWATLGEKTKRLGQGDPWDDLAEKTSKLGTMDPWSSLTKFTRGTTPSAPAQGQSAAARVLAATDLESAGLDAVTGFEKFRKKGTGRSAAAAMLAGG